MSLLWLTLRKALQFLLLLYLESLCFHDSMTVGLKAAASGRFGATGRCASGCAIARDTWFNICANVDVLSQVFGVGTPGGQVNQQLKKRSYKEEEMAARKAARRDVRGPLPVS